MQCLVFAVKLRTKIISNSKAFSLTISVFAQYNEQSCNPPTFPRKLFPCRNNDTQSTTVWENFITKIPHYFVSPWFSNAPRTSFALSTVLKQWPEFSLPNPARKLPVNKMTPAPEPMNVSNNYHRELARNFEVLNTLYNYSKISSFGIVENFWSLKYILRVMYNW